METPDRVIPVIEEELVAETRTVKTGSVRVRKTVEHVQKMVESPAVRDVVSVRRIEVNRVVDVMPQNRQEGDTLIIPVVEEEIIVQKRLVLKEEIHIKRQRTREQIRKAVTVDREHAIVERLDAQGNPPPAPAPIRRRKSILE